MDSTAYFKIMNYIDQNPVATVSTINKDGTPHGSIVYVCGVSNKTICFVTKNRTQKYANIIERPMVSLTIGNEKENSTLQLAGRAAVVNDQELLDEVMQKIIQVHAAMAEWLPPVAKLRAGNYAVIAIEIQNARLAEYQGLDIGSKEIFTTL